MAYPDTIYEQRELENLPGLVYEPDNKKTLFAEDIMTIGTDLHNIEELLGSDISGDKSNLTQRLEQITIATEDNAESVDVLASDLGTFEGALSDLETMTTVYFTGEERIGRWFDNRTLYRKIINCGALPNTTTKKVAHGITNLRRVVHLNGYAYRPSSNTTMCIPYVGDVASSVRLALTGANIELTTGIDRSIFTETFVTLEYTKTDGL